MENECGSGFNDDYLIMVSSEKNGCSDAKNGCGDGLEGAVSGESGSSSDSKVGCGVLAESVDGVCESQVDSGLVFEKLDITRDLLKFKDDPSTKPVVVDPGRVCFGTPKPDKSDKSVVVSECRTPVGSLLNPFACAPEELVMSTPKNRFWKQNRGPSQRRIEISISRKIDFEQSLD